jgi:DNA-binding NtrC family response regulator
MAEHLEGQIVGTSIHTCSIRHFIAEASRTDEPILLFGEPGVGKEIVARTIHQSSKRVEQPFLLIDCSLYYERELRREIFGYRGSGNDAKGRKGILEFASSGTCYLSRIEELSPGLQESLYEFITTRRFRRLGDGGEIRSDVRIMAATEKNLSGFVEGGLFSRELYVALSTKNLRISPLRDRAEDVAPLAETFSESRSEPVKRRCTFTSEAIDALKCFPWPRNIDDLRREMQRVLDLGVELVRVQDLSFEIAGFWLGQCGDPEVRRVVEELEGYIREFRILSTLDSECGDMLQKINQWGVVTSARYATAAGDSWLE